MRMQKNPDEPMPKRELAGNSQNEVLVEVLLLLAGGFSLTDNKVMVATIIVACFVLRVASRRA